MIRTSLALLLIIFLGRPAFADDTVANVSTATEEYLVKREDAKTSQSFVVMQGEFFPGSIRDKGLEKTPFATVARVVAKALQKKTFRPSKSLETADLLIVIHWGVTVGRERSLEFENRDLERARELVVNYAQGQTADAAFSEGAQVDGPTSLAMNQQFDYQTLESSTRDLGSSVRTQSIASLLGFTTDLRKEQHRAFPSEHNRTLTASMEDDRYFILVFAYDLARLRADKRLKLEWTSRLSIRSAGVNFPTALVYMSETGSTTFGTSTREVQLTRAKTKLKKEEITFGEAVIIETLENEPTR